MVPDFFLLLFLFLSLDYEAKFLPPVGPPGENKATLVVFRQRVQSLAGVKLGPCLGRVCALEASLRTLLTLAKSNAVSQLRPPARYRLRLEQAGEIVGRPQVEKMGATGRGVYLAFIDSGIDWRHPDFIDQNGRTRVIWLLDQTLPPRGKYPELEEIGAGAVFDAGDLQDCLEGRSCQSPLAGMDVIGHGTHVAGIAASDDEQFRGMAPQSLLVVVKAVNEDGTFEEDRILRGLVFVHQVALSAGAPLVVNLSLGSQLGAHDGSEPLEIALDEMAGMPGRAVVVAAGNDRGKAVHFRASLYESLTVRLRVPQQITAEKPYLVLDLWLVEGWGTVLFVETPTAEVVGPVSSPGPVGMMQDTEAGRVEVATTSSESKVRYVVRLSQQGATLLSGGIWKLHFRGRASRIDGWLAEVELGGPRAEFLDRVDETTLVGPPATAFRAITVGAYVSRTEWRDQLGVRWNIDETPGQAAYFSSAGPTADGRPKPELSAPGMMVASTLSQDADPQNPKSMFYLGGSRRLVTPDGRHALAAGTSMAAPFVAGAAALILERHPQWSGEEVRRALFLNTRTDEKCTTRGLYHTRWGFGKLDLPRALEFSGFSSAPVHFENSLCGVSLWWQVPGQVEPWGNEIYALAVPRDALGIPLGPGRVVDFFTSDGWRYAAEDLGDGLYRAKLPTQVRRGSSYNVYCRSQGEIFKLAAPVTVASGYGEAAYIGDTSCSTIGTRSNFWALLFFWLGRKKLSANSRCNSRKCSWSRKNHQ